MAAGTRASSGSLSTPADLIGCAEPGVEGVAQEGEPDAEHEPQRRDRAGRTSLAVGRIFAAPDAFVRTTAVGEDVCTLSRVWS